MGRPTHEPRDNTREPCEEGEDCRRNRRRGDKPCDDEDETTNEPEEIASPLLRRLLRRGDEDADVNPLDNTAEPCEGEDCERRQRRREKRERRRNLRNRNRPTREPLAEGETREPRGTKEPCEVTREPCDPTQEDCSRGGKNRRRRRRRDRDETTAAPTEDDIVVRRMLRRGGRRGRGLDAVISGGTVEIAGIVGTVEFGEVSQELESIPLTLTIGETIFTCDVEVRRDGVSCRASSEDNFKVRVGCAIPAEPEL